MDSTDSDKVDFLHMDCNSYQRIRPYSSRHSRRLLSQHVLSLDNHFGENSSNEYDKNVTLYTSIFETLIIRKQRSLQPSRNCKT
ncbi:Uncharacterized protein APZ42_009396 [Daphnia magna]|uniref:Uncharacterized protein n=1 Tax=Daphnia magna TaxID=35525 RepID=A0A164E1F7_9CRUS|nr:Uncharacterized protein APZ42_009396 [Daphnia magna]